MPATIPRECRWLRRAALAIRITVGLLTLACASIAGVVAARTLGGESPWIWTIAFLAGLVGGAVLAASLATVTSERAGAAPSAGLTLGMYYGGTGLGIVAAALLVPLLVGTAGARAWQPAWLGLGAVGLAATILVALATRGLRSPSAAGADPRAATRFGWRAFAPGLAAYFLFGVGYIAGAKAAKPDIKVLSACHPLYSAAKRIIVFARLDSAEAR